MLVIEVFDMRGYFICLTVENMTFSRDWDKVGNKLTEGNFKLLSIYSS